jgi:hypothetical protein
VGDAVIVGAPAMVARPEGGIMVEGAAAPSRVTVGCRPEFADVTAMNGSVQET